MSHRSLPEDIVIKSMMRDLFEYLGPIWHNGQWQNCWACQERLKRNERVSVIETDDGNKLFHNRCYDFERQKIMDRRYGRHSSRPLRTD